MAPAFREPVGGEDAGASLSQKEIIIMSTLDELGGHVTCALVEDTLTGQNIALAEAGTLLCRLLLADGQAVTIMARDQELKSVRLTYSIGAWKVSDPPPDQEAWRRTDQVSEQEQGSAASAPAPSEKKGKAKGHAKKKVRGKAKGHDK